MPGQRSFFAGSSTLPASAHRTRRLAPALILVALTACAATTGSVVQSATSAGVVYSSVQEANGRLFALRLDPDASLPKLVVRDAGGASAAERVLFDPAAGQAKPSAVGR